jgi:RNA polymerase sigma-70 factor (ECF subfamily)
MSAVSPQPKPGDEPPSPPRARTGWADRSEEWWRGIFAELAQGRLRALDVLYEAVADRLYGLALWRTGSADDAADVVHEVFLRVARQRGRLTRVRDPRSWLLTVAHRAALDVGRRRSRRPSVPLDRVALVTASEPDRDRQVDAGRASRLLVQLPPAQRDAIFLHLYADCTFAEIGRITGVPTFTAASRYRLGIAKLRRLMEVTP